MAFKAKNVDFKFYVRFRWKKIDFWLRKEGDWFKIKLMIDLSGVTIFSSALIWDSICEWRNEFEIIH